jgi:hypothetical protein|eukprot:SAG25_NODE_37_length_19691_cov_19.319467_21_plen_173_part_00
MPWDSSEPGAALTRLTTRNISTTQSTGDHTDHVAVCIQSAFRAGRVRAAVEALKGSLRKSGDGGACVVTTPALLRALEAPPSERTEGVLEAVGQALASHPFIAQLSPLQQVCTVRGSPVRAYTALSCQPGAQSVTSKLRRLVGRLARPRADAVLSAAVSVAARGRDGAVRCR